MPSDSVAVKGIALVPPPVRVVKILLHLRKENNKMYVIYVHGYSYMYLVVMEL